MASRTIIPLEKKIFAAALLFCIAMLGFIGFAALRFGITVPGCVTDVKPFHESSLTKKAENHYELHAVAKMWTFDPARIDIPTGTTLDIFVTSIDVNHGFHIDGTNVNLTAVPGAINYARVQFNRQGDYHILCHEYCGVGHHAMYALLHVSDQVKEAKLESESKTSEAAIPVATVLPPVQLDQKLVEQGQKLFNEKGCLACHSTSGIKMLGPTFKGLYGSKVTLSDGSVVVADDGYIAESIRQPQKKIVKGYENIPMPPLPINDDEIKALTELIKSAR